MTKEQQQRVKSLLDMIDLAEKSHMDISNFDQKATAKITAVNRQTSVKIPQYLIENILKMIDDFWEEEKSKFHEELMLVLKEIVDSDENTENGEDTEEPESNNENEEENENNETD